MYFQHTSFATDVHLCKITQGVENSPLANIFKICIFLQIPEGNLVSPPIKIFNLQEGKSFSYLNPF